MKAMKQILVVIGLISVLTIDAQKIKEYPTMQMNSTSAMIGAGSALPCAAATGYVSADDHLDSSSPRGPHRAADEGDTPPQDPNGPMEEPLTDVVPCLLVIALGYTLYVARKKAS